MRLRWVTRSLHTKPGGRRHTKLLPWDLQPSPLKGPHSIYLHLGVTQPNFPKQVTCSSKSFHEGCMQRKPIQCSYCLEQGNACSSFGSQQYFSLLIRTGKQNWDLCALNMVRVSCNRPFATVGQTLPSSKFSHTNLLIQAQLQTDARFDVLMLRHEILHVYVDFFYALSDYGTQKLISDDFLVMWSRDQLLQKAYWMNAPLHTNKFLLSPIPGEGTTFKMLTSRMCEVVRYAWQRTLKMMPYRAECPYIGNIWG